MSTPKKAASPKKAVAKSSHPPFQSMIKKAISSLKEKGGSSQVAILKYILANYKVGGDAKRVNSHLRLALRRGVKSGVYLQPKGPHGKFKLSESKKAKAHSTAEKPKAPRKPRTSSPAKKASPKKKVAAKPKKAKSPAKAKKPAAKKPKSPKKPKVAKSPKSKTGKVGRPKSAKKSPKKAAK